MKHLKTRIPMYFIGLFVMTIGIALSVKSNLGVSPVSSIPYTMTCVWGIEMGKASISYWFWSRSSYCEKISNPFSGYRFWSVSYSVTSRRFVTIWYPSCQRRKIWASVSSWYLPARCLSHWVSFYTCRQTWSHSPEKAVCRRYPQPGIWQAAR